MATNMIMLKIPDVGSVDDSMIGVAPSAATRSVPASNEVRVYQAGAKTVSTPTTNVISAGQRRFYSVDTEGSLVQNMSWENAPNKEALEAKIEKAISEAKAIFKLDITPLAITIKNGMLTLSVKASDTRNEKSVNGTIVISDEKVHLFLPETYDGTGKVLNYDVEYSYNL